MKPSLTAIEAVAWDRLAQAFDYYHRTGQHAVDQHGRLVTEEGICLAVWNRVDQPVGWFDGPMHTRAKHNLPPARYEPWYSWPLTRKAARYRAAFCRRMAEQCRSEL